MNKVIIICVIGAILLFEAYMMTKALLQPPYGEYHLADRIADYVFIGVVWASLIAIFIGCCRVLSIL